MNTTPTFDAAVPLPHWGLIRARGADAVKFLQGQLTNDLLQLEHGSARLAGFCSAKGRLQASFVAWKASEDDVFLACAASLLPATLKRLSMFVMRAQCKLSDASAEFGLFGLAGSGTAAQPGGAGTWSVVAVEGGFALRLPDVDGVPRNLLALAAPPREVDASPTALARWQALEVRSGIPMIEAATVDQFVPQMLNYELLGGVDFGKGCYPGQEVVARSQYRGTTKRRMFLFECDATVSPAQEVFHEAEPGQPAGMVVNAAALGSNASSVALIVVKLAALESGSLRLGDADGPPLRHLTLPYAVPLDASEAA